MTQNIVYGKVGNIEFSYDKDLAEEASRIHGLDMEKEIKEVLEREMKTLHQEYPDAEIVKAIDQCNELNERIKNESKTSQG